MLIPRGGVWGPNSGQLHAWPVPLLCPVLCPLEMLVLNPEATSPGPALRHTLGDEATRGQHERWHRAQATRTAASAGNPGAVPLRHLHPLLTPVPLCHLCPLWPYAPHHLCPLRVALSSASVHPRDPWRACACLCPAGVCACFGSDVAGEDSGQGQLRCPQGHSWAFRCPELTGRSESLLRGAESQPGPTELTQDSQRPCELQLLTRDPGQAAGPLLS